MSKDSHSIATGVPTPNARVRVAGRGPKMLRARPAVAAMLATVVSMSALYLPGNAAAMAQVDRYKVHELVFTASSSPSNPFETYLLRLEITDPVGGVFTIDGYFDGDGNGGQTGNVWKARISPYMTGVWSWRTVTGDAADSGLAGLSGQFDVVAGSDKGGVVRNGQQLQYQNGDFVYQQAHFLDNRQVGPPLNGSISTHVFMAESGVDDAIRAQILSNQINDHAVNKINLYYSNECDYQGQRVNPWLGSYPSPDRTKMSLSRWKLYDGYLETFKNNGIHASMWGFSDCYSSPPSQSDLERLLRYAMARHSAYNHTSFTLGLEYLETFSTGQMNAVGTYLATKNPWDRLLTVHHLDGCSYDFAGQAWIDYASTQSDFGSDTASVNNCAINVHDFLEPNKPAILEEYYVDSVQGETVGRRRTWANMLGGAAGGGTGAGLRAFMRFLEVSRMPHQRMVHNNSAVDGGGSSRFVSAESGQHHLVYTLDGSPFTYTVTGSGLTGYWYNPRQIGASLQSIGAVSSGSQQFTPPSSGGSDDWVLWITSGANLNSGNLYASSGATPTQEFINGGTAPTTPAAPSNLQAN